MVWRTCVRGHDLTGDDAWIYSTSGLRECRRCVYERSTRKAKRPYGWDTALSNKWRA